MKQTKSVEDYLEAILMIEEEKGIVRSVDVAAHLNYSKPSVSIAMHNLEEDGSVKRGDDGRLLLTERGRAIAEQTLARHRFLTGFLEDIGVDADVAERDACGMEHSISAETFDHLREWYSALKASDSGAKD